MITKYFTGIKTVDKIIFVFILLFIVSLTNSIFVNQIGYFIPLLLLVYIAVVKKERRFEKNGLELAFILFLSAELISAVLSADKEVAFTYFFKRLILIPIIYTIVSVADNSEKAKLLFKFYLGAALITMMVYIIFAYEHFISQLYRYESKGPSPFQYVMTAGGLMSFTTIFFFALLINERTNIAKKLFYLFAFSVSSIALFASYTRAAWIGAVAGIITIIIIKRKWIILIPIGALIIIALLFFKSESKIYQYVLKDNKPIQTGVFDTGGKAIRVISSNDSLLVADYENGVGVYKQGKIIQQIETPVPVTQVKKWYKNYFIAYLVDTRILLMKKNADGKIYIDKTFTSPGKTTDFKVSNNKFYISDEDSGLTVFQNPLNLLQKISFRRINQINSFECDSTKFISYSAKDHQIKLYSNRDGLPVALKDSFDTKSYLGSVWLLNNMIYFQGANNFSQFIVSNGKLRKVGDQKLLGIMQIICDGNNIYACSLDGKIYTSKNDSIHLNTLNYIGSLGYSPSDFISRKDTFYTAYNKRNRLASVIDPYHETNIERFNIWRTGFKIFADYPIFGVGDIDLGKSYSQYKDNYLKENFGHMHNNFVHFLVILGGFGFIIVMFLLIKIFVLHLKIYKTLKDVPLISSYALGAAAAFVGFLFSGLGEWNFGDQEIITMVWFTLGLNIAFYKSYIKTMNSDSSSE